MHLNEAEIENIEENLPKYFDALSSLNDSIGEVKKQFDEIQKQIETTNSNHSDGIPLLRIKNECMAQYLADLISVAGHQLNGKSIEGSDLVNRLIEERVTLERIRPLEDKLKYKIDKLTKIAHGNIDKNDPLQIKPNVDNLDLSDEDDDEEEDEDEDQKTAESNRPKTGLYRAPRKQMVHYDGEDKISKEEKASAHERKRAIKSSVMREIWNEYGDEPEQLATNELQQEGKGRRKDIEAQAHKIKFEEENFIRIQEKKGHRNLEKKRMKQSELNNLTHFGDTSAIHSARDGAEVLDAIKRQKRKQKDFKKKGGSGNKRRRK